MECGSGWPSDPNNGQRPTSLELRRAPHTEANKKISRSTPRSKATSTLTNTKHCDMHSPALLLLVLVFLASRPAAASSLLGKWQYSIIISQFTLSFRLDFLDFDVGGTERRENEDNTRSCACNGPACMCCVDFNLTYIDLGGPGKRPNFYLST